MIDAFDQALREKIKARESRCSLLLQIRYREVLMLQGTPLMGAALAIGHGTGAAWVSIGILFFGGFLLVGHIWSLNDWVELPTERSAPVLGLSLTLLILSLLLFTCLGRTPLLIAIGVASLGFVYSHPAINTKGRPVLSSATHLAGGVLHFLLGYSVFSTIDRKAVMISSFFALVFTAGHATQEVEDYEDDRLNGIRTNPVVFGKASVFIAAFIAFAFAYGDLALLSFCGYLPSHLWLIAVVLFPLHCRWSLRAWRAGLCSGGVRLLRDRYRILFLVIGMAIAAEIIYERFR